MTAIGSQRALALGALVLSMTLGCREAEEAPSAGASPPSPSTETAPAATTAAEENAAKASPKWPRRAATRSEVENTLKALELLVEEGATDPDDPWSMAHGIVAFGPELRARDGRFAVDAIVADYIQSDEAEDGSVRWFFPDRTPGGRPLQPHDNLIAKVLSTSDLPPDRAFPVRGGREVTLAAIIDSVEATFERPETAHAWGEQAWTLEAVLVSNPAGTKLELDGWSPTYTELAVYGLEALSRLQAFLETPMAEERPDLVEKKKQGIYAHTCGGLHLVQAAVRGAMRVGAESLLSKAREQLDIVRFRFDAERRIYRETIAEAPKFRTLLLVQEMKFYGHVLETFGLAAEWGAITPTPELSAFIRDVAGDLVDSVRELESAYAEIDMYRSKGSQTYYDLIGDGCHAVRGLRLTAKHFYDEAEAP